MEKWVMRTYDFPEPQTPMITTAIPAGEKQNPEKSISFGHQNPENLKTNEKMEERVRK